MLVGVFLYVINAVLRIDIISADIVFMHISSL